MVSGSWVSRASRPPCGIENGLCEKSTFFSSSFHSNIGKSTIQQNLNCSLGHQLQLGPDPGAGQAGELGEHGRIAGHEEGGVALAQAQRLHQRLGRLAQVLGDRAAPRALVFRPEDVAQARLALALRPAVHAVAEGAAAAGRGRDGPDGVLGVGAQDLGEQAETAVAEVLGDVGHLDRVAQVRLVAAVPGHRLGVGQALEALVLERGAEIVGEGVDAVDRRHRLAARELLEHAVHHRLDGREHVFLRDEAHLDVELVEFQRSGRRAGPRRGSTGRSGNSGRSPRPSAAA
jgi:hypothetical protein